MVRQHRLHFTGHPTQPALYDDQLITGLGGLENSRMAKTEACGQEQWMRIFREMALDSTLHGKRPRRGQCGILDRSTEFTLETTQIQYLEKEKNTIHFYQYLLSSH